MLETDEEWCDLHDSHRYAEYPCECHLFYFEAKRQDELNDMWEEQWRFGG